MSNVEPLTPFDELGLPPEVITSLDPLTAAQLAAGELAIIANSYKLSAIDNKRIAEIRNRISNLVIDRDSLVGLTDITVPLND